MGSLSITPSRSWKEIHPALPWTPLRPAARSSTAAEPVEPGGDPPMRFVFETRVARSRGETYRFFSDPGNLALVLGELPSFALLRHDRSVAPGSQTWVLARTFGVLPIVLGFEHVHCDAGVSFAERLIHGPFSRFDHLHEFSDGDGGTAIRDTLDIELPWQYGGGLVTARLVAPVVERLFRIRRAGTIRVLGAAGNAAGAS